MSTTAVQGRVDLDSTRAALEQLGLSYVAESLPQMLNEAVKDNLWDRRLLRGVREPEGTRRRALGRRCAVAVGGGGGPRDPGRAP